MSETTETESETTMETEMQLVTEQLEARHFNGVRQVGVSFVEMEDGDILAYGHVEPKVMAEAVGNWYTKVDPCGALVPPSPDEVSHVWGVAVAGPEGGDEGPYVRTMGVTRRTPHAVPVTRIAG